jgi:hypothetical protein
MPTVILLRVLLIPNDLTPEQLSPIEAIFEYLLSDFYLLRLLSGRSFTCPSISTRSRITDNVNVTWNYVSSGMFFSFYLVRLCRAFGTDRNRR